MFCAPGDVGGHAGPPSLILFTNCIPLMVQKWYTAGEENHGNRMAVLSQNSYVVDAINNADKGIKKK